MKPLFRNAAIITTSFAAGVVLAMSMSASADKGKTGTEIPLADIEMFADVFSAIKDYYVDDVADSKLMENAIKGMVEGLDPHSSYLDFKAFKDLEESTMGEFGGLGIEVTKDPQGVRVVTPIDDTPAAHAGIRAGDLIIKIDDTATAELSLNENVKRMRGKPKTSIVLTIARKGVEKPVVIKIVRDIIKVRSVKSKMLEDNLAYIRVSQFQERTGTDVAEAIKKLSDEKPLKGIIVDLRNNPGGLLDAAVGVSAAFLPAGSTVVSTRSRNAEEERLFKASVNDYGRSIRGSDPIAGLSTKIKNIPVVVIVNQASASASEIVAGALQDHKRATIMGTTSFGKGSVQTILPMRRDKDQTRGIKITTARYYTPSGRTIQASGITPDIAVDDTPEGNYPTFNVRESALANHIEVNEDSHGKKIDKKKTEAEEEIDVGDATTMPKLEYRFGDEKDFVLQQAVAKLTGKHVITHEETQKKLREKKAAKKAEEAKKAKKEETETK